MPGPHPDGDLGVRVSLAIVAVASRIVPSAARSEWLREWNAEVWHRRDRLSRWAVFDTAARVRLVRTCLGAYADALCMRKLASPDADTLDDILCGARRLAESPQRSLAAAVTLASALAVMTTVLALALPSLTGHADVTDAGRLARHGSARRHRAALRRRARRRGRHNDRLRPPSSLISMRSGNARGTGA